METKIISIATSDSHNSISNMIADVNELEI